MEIEHPLHSPKVVATVMMVIIITACAAAQEPSQDVTQRLAEMEKRLNQLEKQKSATPADKKTLSSSKQRKSTLMAEVDFLNWILRGTHPQYGISDIGGVQDRGPVGSILAIDQKKDDGFRLGLSGRPFGKDKDGPEIAFRYTKFDSEINESYAGPLRATFISSDNSENDDSDNINTLGVETITPDDRATAARAALAYHYNVYDLTISQTIAQSQHFALGLCGGARYVEMNHRFHVTYTGGDFQIPFSPFETSNVHGGGMLLGAELDWTIIEGLSANIGAKGGMIMGDIDTSTFIPDDEPGVPTSVTYSDSRTIPYIEMAASLSYTQPIGDVLVHASVGYDIINWFNVMDSRVFTDSHMEGQNVQQTGDLSLDGMYLRIGIGF